MCKCNDSRAQVKEVGWNRRGNTQDRAKERALFPLQDSPEITWLPIIWCSCFVLYNHYSTQHAHSICLWLGCHNFLCDANCNCLYGCRLQQGHHYTMYSILWGTPLLLMYWLYLDPSLTPRSLNQHWEKFTHLWTSVKPLNDNPQLL